MVLLAGPYKGLTHTIDISNAVSEDRDSGNTFVEIERTNDPSVDPTVDTAEYSSNDSNGSKEYVPTWDDMTFTFEMVADEDGAGQGHVWTSFKSKQVRAWRHRSLANAGNFEELFLGIVKSISKAGSRGDVYRLRVTVQRTGGLTHAAQSA